MKKGLLGIMCFLLIMGLTFTLAVSYPVPYPSAFTGNINVIDGKNPNGQTLIGKINSGGNDVATGSAMISNEKFNIVVTTENPELGGTIKFYIGNESAKEIFSYKIYDITHTNLTFDTVPSLPGTCGNGICEQNECSTCPIDCKVSDCLGNGVCDTQMGETCSNDPQDCGQCPVPVTSGGGGGGGGSSSSGGGSSGNSGNNNGINNSPGVTNNSGSTTQPNVNPPLSVENLTNIAKNQNANWVSITGSAILDFTKSGEGLLTFSVLIMALFVLILLFSVRKKRVINKEENSQIKIE
jgi:hypothetical protein